MELVGAADGLVRAASLLTALSLLLGSLFGAYRFFLRQRQQDRELEAIRKELQLLCYGVMSCLDGLKQQGCNHNVTRALDKLEQHLNETAHRPAEG